MSMRGRPKKPLPPGSLPYAPSWISDCGPGNINSDEAVKSRREAGEFHRREAVDEAFDEGRAISNAGRKRQKGDAVLKVRDLNPGTIANTRLSSSAAATIIIRQGRHCNFSHRVLRNVIADLRNNWQGR